MFHEINLKTCWTFPSAFNKNKFLIRHNVTCKSSCVMCLVECSHCEKAQYVGKSECSLKLRMNTQRSDVWRTNGPPCDKHFQMPGHNLNAHARFTIIKEDASHYQRWKFARKVYDDQRGCKSLSTLEICTQSLRSSRGCKSLSTLEIRTWSVRSLKRVQVIIKVGNSQPVRI